MTKARFSNSGPISIMEGAMIMHRPWQVTGPATIGYDYDK